MKRMHADIPLFRLLLVVALLAAQLGCANTKPATLYYIQQDVGDIQIEQPRDGMSQKQFDQKIAEIKAKSKENPKMISMADSLFHNQASYCIKRNVVERYTAGSLFSSSLVVHYFWCRSMRNKYQDVTEQGGLAALGDGIMWTASFALSLPLVFIFSPRLASRVLVGPKVKPKLENKLRELIRMHNRFVADKKDSVQNK